MWILPEMYLFAMDPVLKYYRGCPSGIILENCNIDSCLSKYLHKALDCCVRYTHLLHKLDRERFGIEILQKITSAYPKIFDPIDRVSPSSERIISNTYDVLTPIKYIAEAKGCIIPDVNNVKNKRKRRRRGYGGGVRTPIMDERGCKCLLWMTMVQFRKK